MENLQENLYQKLGVYEQRRQKNSERKEKLGAPKKRETTTKTFRFPLDKREEIIERIKALISFYNNA